MDEAKLDLPAESQQTRPFSILVVDDEEYILAFVSIKLRISGYKVSTATSGIQALEILRNSAPDLVIIDLIMPGMDGIQLLREIRQFSNVPVIVLSAVSSQEIKVRELRAGADDYMFKPFNPDELVARIESIRRRQQGASAAS